MRAKRSTLLWQALLIAIAGGILGWVVETWQLLPMSRISPRWGFPVALLFFGGFGLVFAIGSITDHWNHAITFEDDHLRIASKLGITCLRYDEIAEAKLLPHHGVGIKLRPGSDLMGNVEAKPSARAKMAKLSGIGQRFYQCEVVLASKLLDGGVNDFLTRLRSRLKAVDGTGPA